MSDPFVGVPTLEQRIDDVHAVMDAVGSRSAFIAGLSEGGSMSVLFAGLHPAMTRGLILIGATGRWSWASDYPIGHPQTWTQAVLDEIDERWGRGALIDLFMPSVAENESAQRMWARAQRLGSTPGLARARCCERRDRRTHLLADIQVPTLVIHRLEDRAVPVSHGRYLAEQIPRARLFEQHGDHIPWLGDAESVIDEIERFVAARHERAEIEWVLATMMLVAIAYQPRSRADAGRDGDALAALEQICREQVARSRGRLMSECELHGTELSGRAMAIAASVAEHADPGEILVSRTVTDLIAGSDLRFAERGVVVPPDGAEPLSVFALAT